MKIERQLQGILSTVLTEVIKERGIEGKLHPYPAQEEKRADITIKNKSGKTIFFIELKDPTAKNGRSVFDSETVLRELSRAQKNEIRYFGICNFLACTFFDTTNINSKVSVSEGFFTIQDIARLSNSFVASKDIEKKLRSIATFYIERALEIIEKRSITYAQPDELYIFKIRKLIEAYSQDVTEKVWHKYRNNKKFEKDIQTYTTTQLWNKPSTFEEIENLTHIALLMLISKLIFYKAYVDNQTWHNLSPMKVGKDINNSEELEQLIWQYFEEFKDVTGDYELLIGERSDIIFQIPFVSDTSIELVTDVLDTGQYYDFSKIAYDIIGRIFEELIREDERHKLGQYFTPPHVIDLINAYAIQSENDKVFDPSCGSGTFLVRAYERKKELSGKNGGGSKRHEILLSEIYGNDISGYPAYLSMLNLSIRNTRRKSYPRIINKDFFAIYNHSSIPLHDINGHLEKKPLPQFHAIIGNPPYTRQEDIGAMQGTVSKEKIQILVKNECGFSPSQRTSIYAYFIYHAGAFLKEGGYLAYIVQNSWLDTDYGADLQQYILRNFEIVAIMDSEVERFFPTASVNTAIVILKKQKEESIRNKNVVKFIYFRDSLNDILKQYRGVEKLKSIFESAIKNSENEFFKITCVQQEILKNHKKWSPFLKAPQIYFDILEKGKKQFEPLSNQAEVKFGIKTGNNDFFIVQDITETIEEQGIKAIVNNSQSFKTISDIKKAKLRIVCTELNEYWLIESEVIKPMLTSPKDISKYSEKTSNLPYSIFHVDIERKDLKKTVPFAYTYILEGERNEIHTGSSLAARKNWYDIGDREIPSLSFNYMINDIGRTFFVKAYSNNNFHNIYPKKKSHTLWLYLNSSISWLNQQLIMRSNLGDGAGKIEKYELEELLVPNIDLESLDVSLGETKTFKEELGTLENLKSVNPERVRLDHAVLEAIGYKTKKEREDVLMELYKATYQLIDSRLLKAQSLKGVKSQRNKVEFSVYVEQLKELVTEEDIKPKNTLGFAKKLEKLVSQLSSESSLQKKILNSYWKELFNEPYDQKEIAGKAQTKMF